MRFRAIERCREASRIRMICRCLKISPAGYYAWRTRRPNPRVRENQRLLARIAEHHEHSDGVKGAPRIWEGLRYEGESFGKNRIARLMTKAGLRGIPQKREWQKKPSGNRPDSVTNHLERNFSADHPNTKWVTDITYLRTQENSLYLCVVINLFSGIVVGWSMSSKQDRQMVIQAVLMAVWQKEAHQSVILHSGRGTQFTSEEYQQFLKAHNIISSMSDVGSCADNAAAEGSFGLLKRERIYRRQYRTKSEARSDVFDYIERFHNPRRRRKLENAK